jgi:hypothetical protein
LIISLCVSAAEIPVLVMNAWLGTLNCFAPASIIAWHSGDSVWAAADVAQSAVIAREIAVTNRIILELL